MTFADLETEPLKTDGSAASNPLSQGAKLLNTGSVWFLLVQTASNRYSSWVYFKYYYYYIGGFVFVWGC